MPCRHALDRPVGGCRHRECPSNIVGVTTGSAGNSREALLGDQGQSGHSESPLPLLGLGGPAKFEPQAKAEAKAQSESNRREIPARVLAGEVPVGAVVVRPQHGLGTLAPRVSLVMADSSGRKIDAAPTSLAETIADIHIFKEHEVAIVKATNGFERFTPQNQR